MVYYTADKPLNWLLLHSCHGVVYRRGSTEYGVCKDLEEMFLK